MNIANSASIDAAAASASNSEPGTVQAAVSTAVLKTALATQAANALALINALPLQPALATEGSIGRNVNTFA